jgi:glycerol-3-phosphate acyltransferase PlsY
MHHYPLRALCSKLISLAVVLPFFWGPFFGYFFGAIPFGLLSARVFHLGDIREIGSGNTGATNVLRTGHYGAAIVTLVGDFFKGYFPVWICSDGWERTLVAVCAILGHVFPVWSKFKGGKGVATTAGACIAIDPMAFVVGFSVWLAVLVLTKISSLSGLISICGALPLFMLIAGRDNSLFAFAGIAAVIVLGTHVKNIRRLIRREEKPFQRTVH